MGFVNISTKQNHIKKVKYLGILKGIKLPNYL